MRPDDIPMWTADAMLGRLHALTSALALGDTAALNWAAAELGLLALADASHDGAGDGIKPRPGGPPTASASQAPAAASTNCFVVFAGKANAASPF